MPFSVLMTVEGVLTDDTFDFPGAPSLQEGILLFHGLASVFTVHLSSATTNEEAVRRFLTYGCGIKATQWGSLWIAKEDEPKTDTHMRHLIHAQSNRYDIRYFVTPDPWMARQSIKRGITPLLCPHPSYSRPSFLPHAGQGRADWHRIETEVMNGRLLRDEDPRLQQEEFGGFEAEDDIEEIIP
jgi:hypothetical protein